MLVRRALWLTGALLLSASIVTAKESNGPLTLAGFDEMPKPVLLPDGRLMAIFHPLKEGMQEVMARYSTDNGQSWNTPQTLLKLPQEIGGWGYPVVLVDKKGEVHLFFLNDANTGIIRPVPSEEARKSEAYQSRLDIWHTKSTDGLTKWQPPKLIWKGRAGDMQSVIQLSSGRILFPSLT